MSSRSGAPRARLSASDAAALSREAGAMNLNRNARRSRSCRLRAALDAIRRMLAAREPGGE